MIICMFKHICDTQSAGFSSLSAVFCIHIGISAIACIVNTVLWSKIWSGDRSFCGSVSDRNDWRPKFQIWASDKVVYETKVWIEMVVVGRRHLYTSLVRLYRNCVACLVVLRELYVIKLLWRSMKESWILGRCKGCLLDSCNTGRIEYFQLAIWQQLPLSEGVGKLRRSVWSNWESQC